MNYLIGGNVSKKSNNKCPLPPGNGIPAGDVKIVFFPGDFNHFQREYIRILRMHLSCPFLQVEWFICYGCQKKIQGACDAFKIGQVRANGTPVSYTHLTLPTN